MNTITILHSDDCVKILERKKNEVLEDRKRHPIWPQTYFSGQLTELEYWIKRCEQLDYSQLIQAITSQKDRLMRKDFPLRRGRMDYNRLLAEIRLLDDLITEFKKMKF